MLLQACGGVASAIRRTLFISISVLLLSVHAQPGDVEIYSSESWYRDRTEQEQTWRGVLRDRKPDQGPASRTALLFALTTGDQSTPVYAAGAVQRLRPFVNKRVILRGKLVDLSAEGYGKELWIGFIRTAER
jgi:hypothetical protein